MKSWLVSESGAETSVAGDAVSAVAAAAVVAPSAALAL